MEAEGTRCSAHSRLTLFQVPTAPAPQSSVRTSPVQGTCSVWAQGALKDPTPASVPQASWGSVRVSVSASLPGAGSCPRGRAHLGLSALAASAAWDCRTDWTEI